MVRFDESEVRQIISYPALGLGLVPDEDATDDDEYADSQDWENVVVESAGEKETANQHHRDHPGLPAIPRLALLNP